jgi:hypothetical protein
MKKARDLIAIVIREYLPNKEKRAYVFVWFPLNLFCIERGLYSRTEIGEREIDGSTVHIMGAVGNKTLFDCLPLPTTPSDLISWSLATLSLSPLLT